MKNIYVLLSLALTCAMVATPQGRPVDWPSLGGDARRTGWERSDIRITKDNIKDFQLVLKRKLDGPQAGLRALTPPVVIGLLISYKGFKELGFVAGNSGDLWSIDLDTNMAEVGAILGRAMGHMTISGARMEIDQEEPWTAQMVKAA